MRRPSLLFPFLLLAACAKPAPPAPAASVSLLTNIGDSTTIIESVAMYGGKLYTTDWAGNVWSVDPAAAAPAPTIVAKLPVKPGANLLGEVMDSAGDLLVAWADSGVVFRIAHDRLGAPNFDPKKDVTRFITGAGHANGITIASDGHVWVTGGDRDTLYHTGPTGGKAIPFAGGYSTISADTTMPVRGYVVNGVALDSRGNVYTVNTGTGAVYKLEVKPDHTPGAITKLVQSPELLGADGVVVGPGDTLYINENYRNTFARVSPTGELKILVAAAPDGLLHFPAELVRDGRTFYLANLNFPRGANASGYRPGASIVKVVLP